ncbi:MAG: hypothetical protein HYY22_09875 [Thaumarchaeota archaeon]|nr:hypothetical protein [Nitrososphaerota archaeon]
MAEKASITEVYKEVKAIRKILEELAEKGILESLASESITEEERNEIDQALEETRRGKAVPLSKIKRD